MSMKLLLAVLLLASASLADTPAAISADYREKVTAALAKVNDTLEKATVPILADLVKAGDTAGADEVKAQLKAKQDGEPVMKPHAKTANLFTLYDAARLKALEPAQKAAISRIDALLAGSDGKKLDVVAELGKVRGEIEAGRVVAAPITVDQFFIGRSWYTKAGSEYHFNKDGTGYRLQKMDFDDKVAFTWTLDASGVVEVMQRKQPTANPSRTFFQFVDKKTAFQGDAASSITTPLLSNK